MRQGDRLGPYAGLKILYALREVGTNLIGLLKAVFKTLNTLRIL